MGEISVTSWLESDGVRSVSRYILAILLAGLMIVAAACPRDVETLSDREVTHLAAAQSLIHDFDLQFSQQDLERLKGLSRSRDDVLLMTSSTDESSPRYNVPPIYPTFLAPVVWLAPLRGPAVVNVVLLILAVLVAARSLRRRVGEGATALISACVFASVLYRGVFLFQPTMLLAACVALAMALVLGHEEPAAHAVREIYRPPQTSSSAVGRGVLTGCLVGLVAAHHPLYLLLGLPAAWMAAPGRRRSALAGLIIGLGGVVLAFGVLGGSWGPSPGSLVSGLEGGHLRFSVGATLWNLLYLAVGRNVGVLPYFLPLVTLLGLWKGGSGRSVLAFTALMGILAFGAVEPFNFFGGPAAVGNALLVPWFILLWFLPTRPLPPGWLAATVLLAIPAMYPTWLAPGVEPITPEGVYRHASGRFTHLLPLETTQEALPPGEAMAGRLWIRSLSREARISGASRWILAGEGWSVLHLASPTELAALHLQFGPQAAADLELQGADLGDMVLAPDGGVGFRAENLERQALHPMWWSQERHFNYVLRFRMPMEETRQQTLAITAFAADLERARP